MTPGTGQTMTKTKTQKLAEAHILYTAAKTNTKPKRGARDGSIPTHPVVPCPDLPELGDGGVQKLCYQWLKARRVFCSTHACGRGPNNAIYGIKHSGDIHGILPDGRHFEIETKKGRGGRLKTGQSVRMVDVRHTGGLYFIVHGIPEMEHYFEGLI